MRRSEAPSTRAASTNSSSRNVSAGARTMRATVGISTMVMARIVFARPGPSAATMAMASSNGRKREHARPRRA